MNYIRANTWRAAALLLSAFLVAALVAIFGLPIVGGGLSAKLDAARTTIADIKATQIQAGRNQLTVNREPALKSADIAGKSDAQETSYFADVRRASADRVRPQTRCATSVASVPATDSPTPVDDGDAEVTGMVSVAASDWADFTAAAGQAVMCVRAGQALIAEGVAVASDNE